MPRQFMRDIADIMAERPLSEENEPDLGHDWLRQPALDFEGIRVWRRPDGQLVGKASPDLKRKLKRAQTAD